MVAAGIGIDLAIVVLPLMVGLLLPGPALLRLLLVLAALGLLLAQLVGHCLYGRAAGGLLLGLLTVDAEAGLPTGTARALLAVAHLGSAAGATVLDIRNGPDPSRVTLDELDELAEAAELAARVQQLAAASSPSQQPVQPQPQQPVQPQPQQPVQPQPEQPQQPEQAPTTAALPPESPPALRAVPAQPPSAQTPPLPPSVPPQAPPPPPPPEPAQHPAAAAAPQAPAPPRMTRKELRAREREQERARARQALSLPGAQAPGPERMVG